MPHSLRSHEGYVLIDHRDSPGVPDQQLLASPNPLPVGSGQGRFESSTITCSHCQRIVVMNPERTRERAFCRKCNHYICDGCGHILAQTFECKPFKQLIDELQEQAVREEQRGGSIILTP